MRSKFVSKLDRFRFFSNHKNNKQFNGSELHSMLMQFIFLRE